MASVNGEHDAQDIEMAKILLQLQGNYVRPIELTINTNPTPQKPLTNINNNMNVLRMTAGSSAFLTPKGSENIPLENSYKKDIAFGNLPPKKRPNLFKRYQFEQRRWAQARSFFSRGLKFESQKVQMKDATTQTEEQYFPSAKDEEIKALYAELKALREEIKKTDFVSDKTPPASSASGEEEAQKVPQSEHFPSTSSNAAPRIRYQRKAKANVRFCNGRKKYLIKEENDSDDDSEYQAETEEDQEDEEQESEELEMLDETTSQNNENETMVGIGLGNARVPSRVLKKVDWNGSYTTVTRKLLTAVFPRNVLATHSLTGKQSPAFPNKAAKRKLNPLLVEDIVRTVADRCNVKESQVRTSITTKCADESKMLRYRLQNKKNDRKTSSCSS